MITLSKVFEAQARYGVTKDISNTKEVSYKQYQSGCRRFLSDKTPQEFYQWDRKKQWDFNDSLILTYVRSNQLNVEGFVDDRGELLQNDLIDKLRLDIVDCGVLKEALDDDTVQEIQINDFKTIWIVKGGKSYLYVDSSGKPYQFESDTELKTTVDRLTYNPRGTTPRLTENNPLLNTRTVAKGYRLSAVNSTSITPDMTAGMDFDVTSVTIRKYAPSTLTFYDFVNNRTLTSEMAEFLRYAGMSSVRLVCVGGTSSGKTALLNAIVQEIPHDQRILLIQNPTEIMIYDRAMESGSNLRNVLHWEAKDLPPRLAEDPTTPSMANMVAHSLRNTPDVIVPGEVRTPEEFFQMNRALKTGHRVLSTFHAGGGADAIDRIAAELSTLGGSNADYTSSLCRSIDIVVSQAKLEDGSRHVMTIEELTGRVTEDGLAETRVLFRYVLTGEVVRDDRGKVTQIGGYFEQVEPISERLLQKFYSAGISKQELNFMLDVPPIVEGRSNLPSQNRGE